MLSDAKLKKILEKPADLMNSAHNKYLLANQSSTAIQEYLKKDQRIILPIGSTEQHGPDAVVGVDHITATGIAYTLAQMSEILCAPPLNYGMAMHHLGFPGTMALRPTTYINLIVDLISSLKRHGFKHLIVINGHGGNKGPFLNALAEREDEFKNMEFSFFNWWVMPELENNIIKKYFGDKEGYHATPTEVSLTMALCPGFINLPKTYTCPQKNVDSENIAWVIPAKFREYYPDGVMRADYSLATEDIGKEVLFSVVREILNKISSY
jgi:creatinine amidohydrolase